MPFDYLPSPLDKWEIVHISPDDETKTIIRKPSDNEPVVAVAFKIMNDPFVGTLTYVRVYSGIIKSWDRLLNSVTGQRRGSEDFYLCIVTKEKRYLRYMHDIYVHFCD